MSVLWRVRALVLAWVCIVSCQQAQPLQEIAATLSVLPTQPVTLLPTTSPALRRETMIPAASIIKIVEIAPEDPLFSTQNLLMDMPCTVEAPGLAVVEVGFVRGTVRCGPMQTVYHMQKVRVVVLLLSHPEALLGIAQDGIAYSGSELSEGAVITILSMTPKDKYFSHNLALVGIKCVVDKDGMRRDAEGFYGGAALCGSTKTRYYFFQVTLEVEYTSLMRVPSATHGTDR